MVTDEQVEVAVDVLIEDMFAPHEIPVSDELKAKYRYVARRMLESVACIPALPFATDAINPALSGYYWNTLRCWLDDLQKRHRQAMARYAHLERQHHPSKIEQGKLIELNAAMIRFVKEALARRAVPTSPTDGANG
jgi:hypothetical protein